MSEPKVTPMPGRYAILHKHFRVGTEGRHTCGYCEEIWPCGTVQIANYSHDLERQLAQARTEATAYREELWAILGATFPTGATKRAHELALAVVRRFEDTTPAPDPTAPLREALREIAGAAEVYQSKATGFDDVTRFSAIRRTAQQALSGATAPAPSPLPHRTSEEAAELAEWRRTIGQGPDASEERKES